MPEPVVLSHKTLLGKVYHPGHLNNKPAGPQVPRLCCLVDELAPGQQAGRPREQAGLAGWWEVWGGVNTPWSPGLPTSVPLPHPVCAQSRWTTSFPVWTPRGANTGPVAPSASTCLSATLHPMVFPVRVLLSSVSDPPLPTSSSGPPPRLALPVSLLVRPCGSRCGGTVVSLRSQETPLPAA